jgi:hypothetical protein
MSGVLTQPSRVRNVRFLIVGAAPKASATTSAIQMISVSVQSERYFITVVDLEIRRASSRGAAILEKPVSDRGTLEDLSQSAGNVE